jgi:ASC-1-like (ASCH) protein
MSHAGPSLRAPQGQKMIEVRVRFFTDGHAPSGQILPKHGHANGEVRIARNPSHDIRPGEPIMFNSIAEMPYAVERALRDHNIKIELSSRERRYRV